MIPVVKWNGVYRPGKEDNMRMPEDDELFILKGEGRWVVMAQVNRKKDEHGCDEVELAVRGWSEPPGSDVLHLTSEGVEAFERHRCRQIASQKEEKLSWTVTLPADEEPLKEKVDDAYAPGTGTVVFPFGNNPLDRSVCPPLRRDESDEIPEIDLNVISTEIKPRTPKRLKPHSTMAPVEEPRTNHGRSACFWCSAPTERRALLTTWTDVCLECGR